MHPEAAPEPGSVHAAYVAERLDEVGRYGEEPLSEHVRRHARDRADRIAYVEGDFRLTWAELDDLADRLAAVLMAAGLEPGERVAVCFPDGPVVHALYLAAERAGLVAVGIGPRAGDQELRHLVEVTGARVLVTAPGHRGLGPVARHLVVDPYRPDCPPGATPGGRALGVGDVFLLNSTSGTSGMPKCVVHNQNRWLYFHSQVLRAGDVHADDVIVSLIPAPYGFGLWSAHVTPIVLGATTVLMSRFDAGRAVRLVAEHRATVLAAVTTQFVMMLNAPEFQRADLRSLRCLFTGGEAIPYRRAAEFERRTGAAVLNFYGSNETGMLSYTTRRDPLEARLTTAGRVSEDMRVRLFDGGQSGCRGPATSLGYYGDPAANARLFSPDGWMLTGDLCTVDAEGYLRVVGRASDFIIRGGKNVSAVAVEEQVGSHPSVAMVAAVGVPDKVFGERVCAVVELRAGASLDLAGLTEHLAARGVSKETWPERLEILPRLPRNAGGKVAKAELRNRYRG